MHESMNLASIWKLPVVFVCENNLYAESTPSCYHCAAKDISDRATAYDMPGVVVDGTDIFAVYEGKSAGLKGWYCNVCRPAVLGESAIYCEDLALDLWVSPAGESIVLDEDEFAALKITAEERIKGLAALNELLHLAEEGTLPR